MSELFLNSLEKEMNKTETTNGAAAIKSTGSALLNLFATCGAMRGKEAAEIAKRFSLALAEDKALATKLLFYTRDIRGLGVGERDVFRSALIYFANFQPEIVIKNLENIAFYGRWDDLLVLLNTSLQKYVLEFIKISLAKDAAAMNMGKPITLLAKWLPSENASSADTYAKAKMIIKYLGTTAKEYRQLLSKMRKYIDVVEVKMSSGAWSEIEFSKVPSYAMNRYRTCFYKHDEDRIKAFIEKVKTGEEKINSSTLFPYDIVAKVFKNIYQKDEILDLQWNALPNYIEEDFSALVMADVSGSMNGRPLETSIGLAMYFAERSKGAFHNKFMTFSERPELQTIVGDSIQEKVMNLNNANWDMNTNLESAFNEILNAAIRAAVPQADLPRALIIITDMQFDQCVITKASRGRGSYGSDFTFYDEMADRFASCGYQIPNVIFWNVNDTKDTFQVSSKCRGVQLVSGQSINTFKVVMNGMNKTPYELMVETLNNEWYDRVVVS